MTMTLRMGTPADAGAIHELISANLAAGHLLPRSLEDVAAHAERFLVADLDDEVIGCAELAPLSDAVAEVRSLVVSGAHRGRRTGTSIVRALADRGRDLGFATLCAFTHQPSHFVRMGFSLVPHVWMPEKIAHDCVTCSQFRRCGQYAVALALRPGAAPRGADRSMPARGVSQPRASVERLRLTLTPAPADLNDPVAEKVPA
jgi:amino-acid N-acetyltransferase